MEHAANHMGLDSVLRNFQRNVPGCVTAGLVDIDARAPADRFGATTGELVCGEDVAAIEEMFHRIRGSGVDGRQSFQEIVIFSENRVHLFQRCKRHPNMVLATICRKDTSLGVVMVKSRDMLDVVDLAI